MITLKKCNPNITPFGGIHIIHQAILTHTFPALINNHLGPRTNCMFSFSDIMLNQFYTIFCGGDCAEDVEENLRPFFEQLPDFKIPSADTILNVQKQLAPDPVKLVSSAGMKHDIVICDHLNELIVKAARHTKLLGGSKAYTLDFDQQFIPTEKKDAEYSYKKQTGYFPAVGCIDRIPVYIEGRNGNCHVSFNQSDTFKRMFAIFDEHAINIKRCRMDSGSYNKQLTGWLDEQGALFYIRAENCHQLQVRAAHRKNWKKKKIGKQYFQVNSFEYRFGKKTFRIVAYRKPNKSGQINLHTQDHHNYLFIITNDRQWDEKTIIEFYNKRGDAERLFDIQNNDFNWSKLPFSQLNENTVYLVIIALCNILYQWLISLLSGKHKFLQPYYRLKKFIFRFVCVAAKIIKTGRQTVLKLFTHKSYFFPDTS